MSRHRALPICRHCSHFHTVAHTCIAINCGCDQYTQMRWYHPIFDAMMGLGVRRS